MHLQDGEERTAGSDPRIRFSSLYFIYTSYFHLVYSHLNCFGWFSGCFSSIETSKLSVSAQKRNNRNKRFVLDSAETSFGSSFGCFESKLVSKDTLVQNNTISYNYINCMRDRCTVHVVLPIIYMVQQTKHQKTLCFCTK